MGGAHQQQECRQLAGSFNCCFQATLHKVVHNNWLLVRCVADRLVIQPSDPVNALLRVLLLETTPSQPPPLRFTPWERSKSPHPRGRSYGEGIITDADRQPRRELSTATSSAARRRSTDIEASLTFACETNSER